jgi:hypothetical protein
MVFPLRWNLQLSRYYEFSVCSVQKGFHSKSVRLAPTLTISRFSQGPVHGGPVPSRLLLTLRSTQALEARFINCSSRGCGKYRRKLRSIRQPPAPSQTDDDPTLKRTPIWSGTKWRANGLEIVFARHFDNPMSARNPSTTTSNAQNELLMCSNSIAIHCRRLSIPQAA